MFSLSSGEVFVALLMGHAIADYPLQGDFLSRAKNHTNPIPGIPWNIALANHALIHGAAVWMITGVFWLGIAETLLHIGIDYLKCAGKTNFTQDQGLHIVCKVLWAVIVVLLRSAE